MPDPGEKRRIVQRLKGHMSDRRRAWLNAGGQVFTLYIAPGDEAEEDQPPQVGDSVYLYITRGKYKARVELTDMTQAELVATKQILDMAFANALPTVIRRDAEAEEGFNEGLTSNPRIYRDAPRLFVREGEEFPDRERILRGFDWAPELDQDFEANMSVTRGSGQPLSQRDKELRRAKDNPSEDH